MPQKKSRGFLAAGLGMSCCVLPLILLAVGLGGSLLTVFLVKYKAYLMTLAAGALIYAWVQYTRDKRQCATQLCELTGGRTRKWMLGTNTAVVAFFFLITYTPLGLLVGVDFTGNAVVAAEAGVPGGPIAAGTTSGPSRMERLALRVEGMS